MSEQKRPVESKENSKDHDARSIADSDSEHSEVNGSAGESEEFDSDNEHDESGEYDEIDVTDNPLYQALSAFLETEDGTNVCEILRDIRDSIDRHSSVMTKLCKQLATNGEASSSSKSLKTKSKHKKRH